MEVNPYKNEQVYSDEELLAEVVKEYNSLNERRQYLATMIRDIADKIKSGGGEVTGQAQYIAEREAFLDEAYEGS